MNNIFICPKCKSSMTLPSCSCGYTVPYTHGVFQLTDDPYMVKDDSAEVKYIGYEDIGEYYSGGSIFSKIRIDERYRKIAEIVGSGTLLDLACGDGLYTVPLLKEGVNVIAMDISDKMLSLLYKRAETAESDTSRLIICRANALNIPLTDCSVDAIIANSMLHLISKPEIVIDEIYRVLKKGGKYITFEDKPTTSQFNQNNITDYEKAENVKFNELQNFVHRRYFEILNTAYGIKGTRYSWKFDRENVCDKKFSDKEIYTIRNNSKITHSFNDTFLYRMGGKGYSDQSDVPKDIHEEVFAKVMSEFRHKYGDAVLDTVFTGYEDDVEMTIYVK